MNGIKSQVAKTGKGLASHIAKQIAREPFEILREAPGQVFNENKEGEQKKPEKSEQELRETQKAGEERDKEKSNRLTKAYEAEIRDIQREELFKDIQRRIAEGEDVALENFTELSWEQREVLEAQKVALIERRKIDHKGNQDAILSEPSNKPKRGLFAGLKTRLKRMERKSEIKMPPSG